MDTVLPLYESLLLFPGMIDATKTCYMIFVRKRLEEVPEYILMQSFCKVRGNGFQTDKKSDAHNEI